MAQALKYGLLAAVATSTWLLLAYAAGWHSRQIAFGHYANYGAEIFLALALWLSLRAWLRERNFYWLPVWRGLLQGMATALIAAMGVTTFLSLYLNFINPHNPDLHLDWLVASMRAAGEPEEQVRATARAYRWSTGPVGLPVTILCVYLIFGFIASPLISLWLNWRSKQPGQIG